MEKNSRERLLDAGLQLLGSRGARAATARAAEDAAGLPHGSMHHHFGNQTGYLRALTEYLLRLDAPRPGETPPQTVRRWLTDDQLSTRARYELTLLGVREAHIGTSIVEARDSYVHLLVESGVPRPLARMLVAALDGVVLDGLLRRDDGADLTPLLSLLSPEALLRPSPDTR